MKKSFICQIDKISSSNFKIFPIGKFSVGVIKYNDDIKCYLNVCPHAGAPVCMGDIGYLKKSETPFSTDFDQHRKVLICPWHGHEFDLSNGQSIVEGCGKLIAINTEIIGNEVFAIL